MSERGYLACLPTSWGASQVPGSQVRPCVECDEAVHVHPISLQTMARNPEAQIICMPCVIGMLNEDGSEFELCPLVQPVDEFREAQLAALSAATAAKRRPN